MDYRLLGRTGLRVSPLCLGTMNFGPETDEATSHQIMDARARRRASTSSTPPTCTAAGETEQIIGRWFAQGGGRREKVVLATKVYGGRRPVAQHVAAVGPAHPPGVRGQPAPAADRPHRPLPDAPRRPRHAVGRDLAGDGPARARRARCSTSAARTSPAGTSRRPTRRPRRRGSLGLVSEQSLYNLRARTVELEVLPGRRGLRHRASSVEPARRRPARRRAAQGRPRAAVAPSGVHAAGRARTATSSRRWEALCDELGEEPADVALAWLLHQPAVTAPIIGPRTAGAVHGLAARRSTSRSSRTRSTRLDEIFPGPGGPAPEAYAW